MRMSASCRLVLLNLWRKRAYFGRRNLLAGDGSFYSNDKGLAEDTGLNERTIRRCKRLLQDGGYIKLIPGKFKGCASRYWVLSKPDKMSPFKDIAKPDILAAKGDKLFSKGGQKVPPAIKEQIIINNGDNSGIDQLLKNGDSPGQLLCYLSIHGRDKTQKRLEGSNYTVNEIEKILKLLQPENHGS